MVAMIIVNIILFMLTVYVALNKNIEEGHKMATYITSGGYALLCILANIF